MNEERTGKYLRQVEHTFTWSFMTHIFHNGHGRDRKTFEVMT